MTTKSDLLAAALQGLAGQTAAGARVYGARDLSTWDDEYPVLFVSMPLDEDGESFGRNGAPAFTVSCSLIVEARASALARADDGGALDLVGQLETLRDQVKRAVINYGPLMSQIQQFAFFKVRENPGRATAPSTLAASRSRSDSSSCRTRATSGSPIRRRSRESVSR